MNNTTKEAKVNVLEEKKKLYTGEYGDCVCDYNDGYICDVFTEIADSNVDIYTRDLCDWLVNNLSTVEEANQEFGMPEDGDIIKQIQQGQYYSNEQNLYNNMKDIILNYCFNYIMNALKLECITEDQLKEIQDKCTDVDNNDMLEDYIDFINELFNDEDVELKEE